MEDVLKHVPPSGLVEKKQLKKTCQMNGIGKHLFEDLLDEVIDDEKLFEHHIPRKGAKPAVLMGRGQWEIDKSKLLDTYEQDSQGAYHVPNLKDKSKDKG